MKFHFSIRQLFITLSILITSGLVLAYVQANLFLNESTKNALTSSQAVRLGNSARDLQQLFLKLRLLEKDVLTGGRPYNDESLGTILDKMQKEINQLESMQLPDNVIKTLQAVELDLKAYSENFKKLTQLKLNQRLGVTKLDAMYQLMVSSVQEINDPDWANRLFAFNRLQQLYLVSRSKGRFKATNMSLSALARRAERDNVLSGRLQSYVSRYSSQLAKDFEWNETISLQEKRFDELTRNSSEKMAFVASVAQNISNELERDMGQKKQQLERTLILLGLASIVMVAFGMLVMAGRIIKPIQQLTKIATQVGDGDLTPRYTSKQIDEFWHFGETFNSMLVAIQQKNEALMEYQENLEGLVAKRTRELELAKEEAEKLSDLKSDFISTVSHELRTPLTSVLGFAILLQKKMHQKILPALDTETAENQKAATQVAQGLEIIIHEGERLTTLVDDVLDLSKLEAGVVQWNMTKHSIQEVLEHGAKVCTGLLESKQNNLKCSLEIDKDLPEVMMDRDRIVQVLINLISNAVKFTEHGEVSLRGQRKDDKIFISVTDTGLGIPEPMKNQVFDRFHQLGDTLTDRPKGTGLGLAISKEIIEAHGGEIWVEDAQEQGSVFIFTLSIT